MTLISAGKAVKTRAEGMLEHNGDHHRGRCGYENAKEVQGWVQFIEIYSPGMETSWCID